LIIDRSSLPGNVVADETESSDLRVGLHDPPQCALGVLGHRVGFVQDDQLERRLRVNFSVSVNRHVLYNQYLEQNLGMPFGRGITDDAAPETCLGVSLANVLIFSLTTEIPRSSEAFSSSTRARNKSGLSSTNDP